MNPLAWRPAHQLALLLSAVLGGVIGPVVGYLVYAAPGDSVSFGYWFSHPIQYGAVTWGLLGAGFAVALVYVARLMQQ